MPISKIIFQSWYTRNINTAVQQKIIAFLEKNPFYEYKLYTDSEMNEFVNTNYPGEIADAYNRLNIIVAKVDFWRYLILYKYGGVYLDMDADILDSLDDLIRADDEAIISAKSNPGLFVQWGLIFAANHPILKKAIDIVVKNIQKNRFPNDIHKMTGAMAYSTAINHIHKKHFDDADLYSTITTTTDTVYENSDVKYRVYGIDYGRFMHYTHTSSGALYINKTHWRQEEK